MAARTDHRSLRAQQLTFVTDYEMRLSPLVNKLDFHTDVEAILDAHYLGRDARLAEIAIIKLETRTKL